MSVQFPKVIQAEMKIVRKGFDIASGEKRSAGAGKKRPDAASLSSFSFKDMALAMEESAPNLWYLLHSLAQSSKQSKIVKKAGRNIVCKYKHDLAPVPAPALCALQYPNSHKNALERVVKGI
jgi:hypothetical protein